MKYERNISRRERKKSREAYQDEDMRERIVPVKRNKKRNKHGQRDIKEGYEEWIRENT